MSKAAGHHNVASQLPLIALGDKDASVVRIAAPEGMLVNLGRRAVVVTVPVFGIESIETAGKMNRARRYIAAQLKERRRVCRRRVDGLAAIASAAAGEHDGDKSEKSRCRHRAESFRHEVQFDAPSYRVNGKLRFRKTPTMLWLA
jgi:hypothetical protein